ncbi:MAG: trypsin-like peptidase domain-containing protein [Actinophytocola sp.]|uniref:trypsin-like serine peptidase n=1 Tax=Actinophytocola sp. TaxID=1872138 RepID=UPI003C74E3C1
MRWSTGGWAYGSGALIDDHHILTCSHNLIDAVTAPPPRGEATEVRFYRAYNQQRPADPPPGGAQVSVGYYNVNFRQGQAAWDVGVCRLAEAVHVDPPFAYFQPTVTGEEIVGEDATLTGYPGPGEGEMYEDADDEVAGVHIATNTLIYTHDTWSGNSGSPVWTYDSVMDTVVQHGIHVSRQPQELRRAVLITQPVLNWIMNACAQPNPGGGFTLVGL